MKIFYDELGFFETHGGVSRLFAELMRNLPPDISYDLSVSCTRNVYLKDEPFKVPNARRTVTDFVREALRGRAFPGVMRVYKTLARLMPDSFPSMELENERSRMRAFQDLDFDIYHTTVPHPMSNTWRSVVGKRPIVTTVVDLIPEILNHNVRVRMYRAKLLRDSAHVIAITEKTKRDVLRLYDVPESKISVVYLGYNASYVAPKPLEKISSLNDSPYVLFVGKRGGYKNFNWMIKALAPLIRDGLSVFCTGVPFSTFEKALFAELGVSNRIFQSFVSDGEMRWLFENALAFVHPSIYEGFGIPILDAFSAGCPALLANASCFPEVAGDAALYFDPKDDGSTLRDAILTLSGKRAELIAKGNCRLSAFSWQKCAIETANVYRRLVC